MENFIIYGLPRSRTYWLSRYLTYGDWMCGHDEVIKARSLDDIKSWFAQRNVGTIETSAAPFWRLVKDIKTIVIRRPIVQVLSSLEKQGFRIDDPFVSHMRKLDSKLDQIEHRVPNVLSYQFDELNNEEAMKQLFEHCLPYQHDPVWFRQMGSLNLQVNMRHVVNYYQAYKPQIDKLVKIAKHETIKQINSSIENKIDDGLIIQEEKLADCLSDARKCVSEHLVQVGESPDAEKNWELFQTIEDIDMMQIVIARCNGKMFGYHMFLLSPSLEKEGVKVAVQATFFASPAFRNLGMKLQRASLDLLKSKGIDEVHYPAGKRGSGPRLGTIYKRLGASLLCETYKLEVNNTLGKD